MTNHWIDLKNANVHLIMGSNAVENHPIASRWIWKAKEENNATIIHVDPRFTRTSAKADIYAPIRSGTDIVFLGGMIRWMIEKFYETGGPTVGGRYINQKYTEDCTNALFKVRTDFKDCRTSPVGDFSASSTWDYQYGATYYPYSTWAPGTGYTVGNNVIPTAPNSCQYQCTVAGSSDLNPLNEPVWPTTIGSTIFDPVGVGPLNWKCIVPIPSIKRPLRANLPTDTPPGLGLDDPDCVFQKLRNQYSAYTPDVVEKICGTPAAKFEQICEAYIGGTYADDKAGTMLYAMGWTQHTVGTQNIRAATIIQSLLGNIGVAGGGIDALRGWHNVQGATDHGLLQQYIPGYLALPTTQAQLGTGPLDVASTYLKGQIPIAMDPDAPTIPQSSNWWGMFAGQYNRARYMVSMLKAWWPSINHNVSYSYLPKRAVDCTYLSLMKAIDAGTIKGLFCWGTNPMVMGPDQTLERAAIKKLQWLVVCDLFETETAAFWKNPDDLSTGTEVWLLPGAYAYEKAGSASNSGRLMQWRDRACAPPGDARDELDIVNDLGAAIKGLYPAPGFELSKDSPIVQLNWPCDTVNLTGATLADKVAKEVNGYALTAFTTPAIAGATATYTQYQQLSTFFHLDSFGNTACGNWLFTGTYQATGNQMRNRDPIDYHPYQIGIHHKWGYSWPVNRRIIYNRAAVYQSTSGSKIMGAPLNPNKPVLWWDQSSGYGQVDSGTVTGSTTLTLTDTSKSWGNLAGKKVAITSGTSYGHERIIAAGNTNNQLTVTVAWTAAPPVGSTYIISTTKWNWNYNNLSTPLNPATYPMDVVDGFGVNAPNTLLPYIMREEGVARLMGRGTGLVDGPLPEHWEPKETPLTSNILTAGAGPLSSPYLTPQLAYGATYASGGDPNYPIVCTTFRLTEHWHGGGFTRNCPTQVEMMPEPFIEMSEELAKNPNGILGGTVVNGYGPEVSSGDLVTVSAKRGATPVSITLRAYVTMRWKPFVINGNTIHEVGLPWHWGWASLAPGESANMLTPYIGDANTRIPETKVFLVNIVKM